MNLPAVLRPLLGWGALTVVAVLASLAVVRLLDDPPERSSARPEGEPEQAALAVLHDWDERRAAAWAAGDVAALRALYATGSDAGERDVRLLRSYVERGLTVEHADQQLLRVRLVDATAHRLTVRVRDRLTDATVLAGERRLPLPRDRPSTNDVVLVRQEGEWRVWSVDRARAG